MKRINLKSVSKSLSDKEMKLISGGYSNGYARKENGSSGHCCVDGQCDYSYRCNTDSDCSAWGNEATCRNDN
ncbi:MAG: hypothetical protein RR555_04100 [Bacteroidales bacterium]